MANGPTSPVRSLAKAVSAAFAAASLTPEEQAARIEHTDLEWTCPPLVCEEYLGDAPLSAYLDLPMTVDADALLDFWGRQLHDMYISPSSIMHGPALRGSAAAIPGIAPGVRAYAFSQPIGYPDVLDPVSGVMLSLEVARVAELGLPIVEKVSDDDNHYVALRDGTIFGVKDGEPAIPSAWGDNFSGMIGSLVISPRGASTSACQYDHLAYARSLLHVHRDRFVHFIGVDRALQALRYLTRGGHCPNLLMASEITPGQIRRLEAQERVLQEMVDLMAQPISDRAKLYTLQAELVPAVLSKSAFRINIYYTDEFPFVLRPEKVDAIKTYLAKQLAQVQKKLGRQHAES